MADPYYSNESVGYFLSPSPGWVEFCSTVNSEKPFCQAQHNKIPSPNPSHGFAQLIDPRPARLSIASGQNGCHFDPCPIGLPFPTMPRQTWIPWMVGGVPRFGRHWKRIFAISPCTSARAESSDYVSPSILSIGCGWATCGYSMMLRMTWFRYWA